MLPRLPVDDARADGLKPRWARRDWAHRLLTAALLWFFAGSVRASCPRPESSADMVLAGEALLRLHKNDFPEGSTATFQCSVGYVRDSGQPDISCIGGKWTEVTLKCKKKSCGSPGEVQNGRFDFTNGIEFGAVVKAFCNEGYVIVGQDYRQCLDKGWTGRIPTCEVVQCEEPPEVPNGKIVSGHSSEFPQYRDTIQYECNAGYTLVGKMHIMCNATGEYEPQAPACSKDTDRGIVLDPRERTPSVTVDEDEETTSAVTEVDNAGRSTELPAKELYKVHLQKQIRKSEMEMDLIQLQMEEKRLSIKKAKLEIELLEHRLKVDGARPPYKLHNFVTFACNNGYKMDGGAEMTCTVDGWSHWPTCKPGNSNSAVIGLVIGVAVLAVLTAIGGCVLYGIHKKKTGDYHTREEELQVMDIS
nr:complement decay-accelerating factor-like [Paramormyrops kingsleyae]